MTLDDVMMLDGVVSAKPGSVPEPPPVPALEPVPAAIEPTPAPAEPEAVTPSTDEPPSKGGRKPVPDVFRTSLYFHRTVHDALREIAYDERLTISDLINEGIDQVLKGRGYPLAAELKTKGARKRKR